MPGIEQSLQNLMKRVVDKKEVAGLSILVEKGDQELFYLNEGMADIEKGKKIQRDTIWRLYSQSKPITAAAAMLLMERGELDLCQPVSDFIPEYAETKVMKADGLHKPEREILVHDLLRMTSGLVYPDENTASGLAVGRVYDDAERRMHTDHEMTTMEFAKKLAECPLAYDPGNYWQYGTSADVLGAVIEAASGMKFSEFLEKELFDPMEMNDTGFWVPQEKQNRMACAYTRTKADDGAYTLSHYTGENLAISSRMETAPGFESGGAGLASTLDDYMKFARMLRRGGKSGEKQILSPATVQYMVSAELMPIQQEGFQKWIGLDGFSYGNLMRICKNPDQYCTIAKKGEYGWDGWLGMYFANFPQEDMTILMGTQLTDTGTFDLTRRVRNIILSGM